MNYRNLLKWADYLERNWDNQAYGVFEKDEQCCLLGSLFRACDEELGPHTRWDIVDRFTRAYHWVDMWGNKEEYGSFRKKAMDFLGEDGPYKTGYKTHALTEILVNLNDKQKISFTEFVEFIREWVRQREAT